MFRVALHLRRHLPGVALACRSDLAHSGLAVGLAALTVLTFGATSRALLLTGATEAVVQSDTAVAAVPTTGAYITTGDNWFDQLTNPSAWRDGRFRGQSRPMSRQEERREREQEEHEAKERRLREEREVREAAWERAREYGRERGTYRTVCVRLCDGFFFPISFATTPDRFAADEAECNARCSSGARLYVYPNPGGEPEDMRDVRGQPYTALKNAFLFRTEYVEACTCRPHPWEQEALDRHRLYAERAQKSKRAIAAKVQPARRNSTQTHEAAGKSENPGPRPVDIAAPNPIAQPEEGSGEAPIGPAQASPPTELAESPQRPGGAMLLGAPATKSATRRASRARSAGKEPPRERRSTSTSRRDTGSRPDWAARVFGGTY
ncbi:MAG: DUF2865 domain-containing protein [Hyphomicrobiales bacterium]|nr:DUF2865 domain-containing protein [Hyphomicrobiales bacterium]